MNTDPPSRQIDSSTPTPPTPPTRLEGIAGKRVVVMGLGHFGGGVGVTRFLVERGAAHVLVTDLAAPETLADSLEQLADLPVTYRLGEHQISDFTSADLIVANPAVPPDNRFLHTAHAASIPITSEIRLFVQHLPNRLRTIGITGSAGKSTTTHMIHHALRALSNRPVWIGGNLGGSLLSQLDEIHPDHWVVIELSSFMLAGLGEDRWSPHIAVVTNLHENHLDWHKTLESYADAKAQILRHQQPGDLAILGPNLPPRFSAAPGVHLLTPPPPTPDDLSAGRLLVPGIHNRQNATMAAAAVAAAAGINADVAFGALEDYPGLPHRLNLLASWNDVRFFDDSKSTTPEAAILALSCFPPGSVHLIAGGYDKGSDLTAMAHAAARDAAGLYTIGVTGPALADAASAAARRRARVVQAQTLDQAVFEALRRVHRGDVVLLSPGCASWDQFTNYEARGRAFLASVLRYTTECAPPPGLG